MGKSGERGHEGKPGIKVPMFYTFYSVHVIICLTLILQISHDFSIHSVVCCECYQCCLLYCMC